jgi:hypothetical protein
VLERRAPSWVFPAKAPRSANNGLAPCAAVGRVLPAPVEMRMCIPGGVWAGARASDIRFQARDCAGHGGDGDGLLGCGCLEIGDVHAEGGVGVGEGGGCLPSLGELGG